MALKSQNLKYYIEAVNVSTLYYGCKKGGCEHTNFTLWLAERKLSIHNFVLWF